jgi:hypothetical protein
MEIFYMALTAANCKYEVQVNNFSLFKETIGYQVNTELAFNQLIIKPALVLNIDITPINTQPSLNEIVSFECRVFSKIKNLETETTLYQYRFKDTYKNLPKFNLQETILLNEMKYIPIWSKGESLEINPQTVSELYYSYQTLWHTLKNNDINYLKELISLREETYASCYGNSLEERYEFSLSTFKSHLKDNEYHLFEFKPEAFNPKLQCFGKVISLEDEDGFQPVFFLKNDMQGSINIPAYYSKIKGAFRIVL